MYCFLDRHNQYEFGGFVSGIQIFDFSNRPDGEKPIKPTKACQKLKLDIPPEWRNHSKYQVNLQNLRLGWKKINFNSFSFVSVIQESFRGGFRGLTFHLIEIS